MEEWFAGKSCTWQKRLPDDPKSEASCGIQVNILSKTENENENNGEIYSLFGAPFELMTNTSILIIIGLQVILALLAATLGTIWIVNNDNKRNITDDPDCFITVND